MGSIEFALSVVLVGITIVFLALIGLTLIFMLYGKIASSLLNKKKDDSGKPPLSGKPNKAASAKTPVVEKGIPGEVIAAISAAVACMMGAGAQGGYTVRSVKRAASPRSQWRAAGIWQNTRPF